MKLIASMKTPRSTIEINQVDDMSSNLDSFPLYSLTLRIGDKRFGFDHCPYFRDVTLAISEMNRHAIAGTQALFYIG